MEVSILKLSESRVLCLTDGLMKLISLLDCRNISIIDSVCDNERAILITFWNASLELYLVLFVLKEKLCEEINPVWLVTTIPETVRPDDWVLTEKICTVFSSDGSSGTTMCLGRNEMLKPKSHGGRDPEKGDSDLSDFSMMANSGNELFKKWYEEGVKGSSLFDSRRHAALRIITWSIGVILDSKIIDSVDAVLKDFVNSSPTVLWNDLSCLTIALRLRAET